MKRLQYMATRVLQGLLALLVIATANFMLVRAAPGDPVSVIAGEAGATDAQFVAQLRQQFGLDQPVSTQLGRYLAHVVQGDLGFSYRQQQPVLALIAERLPATLLLTGSAFVLSLLFGVALGAIASRRPGSWMDSAITVVALVFYATPLYWLAMMAVLLFTVQLGWLPGFGHMTVGADLQGLALLWDKLQHLLLPVVTLAGIQAGGMIGGAVLTETVFAWPGIGRLMFDALLQRDYNLLLGCFLVTAAMAVLFNLLTDLVYTLVDPRIELH